MGIRTSIGKAAGRLGDACPGTRRAALLRVSCAFLMLPVGLLCVSCADTIQAHRPSQEDVALRALQLTTERCRNPLGIDEPRPRLGWQLSSELRGDLQSAYQIQVQASFDERWDASAEPLWDSGKQSSAQSVGLGYGGPPLRMAGRYLWRVKVWDAAGRAAPWSVPASWEMGLLRPENWQAAWIGDGRPEPPTREAHYLDDPAPLLRRTFELSAQPLRARLYLAGPGYWEASLNGEALDDSVLNPSWTAFDHLVSYRVFDVSALLRTGENVLGVMLGNGWYNPLPLEIFKDINFREHMAIGRPCVRARLVVTLAAGEELVLTSDESWRWASGPMLRNNIYLGEVYDARLEPLGWQKPGFDASAWQNAQQVEGPKGELRADTIPPIRPRASVAAVSLRESAPATYVFDMGRNLAGWVRLGLQGSAGQQVTLRYSELLNEDGSLNMGTSMAGWVREAGRGGPGAPARAEQRDVFIARGGERELYQPRFTFHGFRYVEVSGLGAPPELVDLVAIPLQSDLPTAGAFQCSDEGLNAIQGLVDNTFRSNLFSVQSDCPHRERLAYGGDIVVTSEAFMLNYDMGRFYTKTLQDYAHTQGAAGGLAQTAPFVGLAQFGLGEQSGPVGWGLALPHLLLQNYRFYGERRQLEEHYGAARKWLSFLSERSEDKLINVGLGDHGNITYRRYVQLVTTLCYARTAGVLARLASVLGLSSEAQSFLQLEAEIHSALRGLKPFSKPRQGRLGDGSQTAQAVGLASGLLQGAEYQLGLTILLERLRADEFKIETGLVGTQDMFEVLAANDEIEAAMAILTRREYPGWGFMLEQGASTLWEVWVDDRLKISRNHPMLGSISAWFYRHLAGIQIEPDALACDRVRIRPQVPAQLTSASGSYASVRGEIKSSWRKENTQLTLSVSIPVGVRAKIGMPAAFTKGLTESGIPFEKAVGLVLLDAEAADGRRWVEVGAGSYVFQGSR